MPSRPIQTLLLTAVMACPALHAGEAGREWHVAVTGDDAAAGTMAKPLRSIAAAARQAGPGDTVLVHAGTYRETVTPVRSGTAEAPIAYRPYGKDAVVISGADPLTGWKPAGNGLVQAAMPADHYVSAWNYADQVFVDGTMVQEARWPDLPAGELSYPRQATITAFVSKVRDKEANWTTAVFEDDACPFTALGKDLAGAGITVQPGREVWSWTSTGTVVKTEATAAGGTRFTTRTRNDGGSDGRSEVYDVGAKYHLFGHRALLDAPGEWHHDRTAGTILLRLPAGADPARAAIEARRRDWGFNLDGRAHITVSGFRLFACTITTDTGNGDGIGHDAQGADRYPWRGVDAPVAPAHDIAIEGIEALYPSHFTDQSGHFYLQHGMTTGLVVGGSDNTVRDCRVRFSAGNGISIYGNRSKALRNTILDVSYMQQDGAGISTHGGAGPSFDLEIAWNTISRCGRSGLTARNLYNSVPGSGTTRIHHNDISHFMIQDSDGGGLYTFGIPSAFVRIDHNLVHDGYGSARGIYVDYGGEYIVDHNVVWNVQSPLYLLKATSVVVYNNTLVDCYSGYDYQGMLFGIVDNCVGAVAQNNLGITYHPIPEGSNESDQWPIGREPKAKSHNHKWDARNGSASDPRVADLLRHDYRLTAASPIRGKGVMVQDHTFTRDGKAVVVKAYNDPADGAPNIGAYEGAVAATPAPGPNLALARTVTASSSHEDAAEGFGVAKLTDGIIDSTKASMAWRSNADTGRQHAEWVQIDLGSVQRFARVDLHPRNDGPTQPWGWDRGGIGRGLPVRLTLLASDDPGFASGVTVLATDRKVYERPHGWSYAFKPVSARYLRIVGDELIGYVPNDAKRQDFTMQLAEAQVYAEAGAAVAPRFPGPVH